MNDEKFPKERRVVVITAVLFLHLILVSTHIVLENQRTLLQNLVALVISPFQIGFQKTVDYISFEMKHYVLLKKSFERYNDLREKYVRLIRENYALKRKMIDQDFVENLKSTRSEFIQADVISIDRNYPYGSLFIDKGSEDGIKKDMIVLNETGELVGKTGGISRICQSRRSGHAGKAGLRCRQSEQPGHPYRRKLAVCPRPADADRRD